MPARARGFLSRKRSKAAFAGGVAALLGGALGLWFIVHYKPAWYRPPVADAATVERAKASLAACADRISDRLVLGRRFEVVVRADEVNDWLASWPSLDPRASIQLPDGCQQPAVGFAGGAVWLGAHVAQKHWQSIVSLAMVPALSADGATLHVRLDAVRGGSLPIPRAAVRELVDPLLNRARRSRWDTESGEEAWFRQVGREMASVEDLFTGVEFDNRFVWPNGERAFRIDALAIEPGAIKLVIEPL